MLCRLVWGTVTMNTYVALTLTAGLSTSPTLLQRTSPQLQQELAEQLSLPFIPCNELLLQVDNKAKHPSSSPSQKILFPTPEAHICRLPSAATNKYPLPRPSAAIEPSRVLLLYSLQKCHGASEPFACRMISCCQIFKYAREKKREKY
jgi:hypothetical protein